MFEVVRKICRTGIATRKATRGEAPEDGAGPSAKNKTAKKIFKKSLHIRHLDSGSCNGCDFEMNALTNPVYDIQCFGVDFVASPRHADMLMVTSGVTRHLEQAVRDYTRNK